LLKTQPAWSKRDENLTYFQFNLQLKVALIEEIAGEQNAEYKNKQ
jgi:hypothetical protein